MPEYEVSLLGYVHLYDQESEEKAREKVKKQGSIGHPQGLELTDEGEDSYSFDVYSHITVEAEDEEEAKEKAMEKSGYDSGLCKININEKKVEEI